MVDKKTVCRNVANLFVSILLFIAYVYFFGTQSFKKYHDKEIIITEQEEDYSYEDQFAEPPPGKITYSLKFYPRN